MPQLHFEQTKTRGNVARNLIATLMPTACAGDRPSTHVDRRAPIRFQLGPISVLSTAHYSHFFNLVHDVRMIAHKRQRPVHCRRGRFYASAKFVDERRE